MSEIQIGTGDSIQPENPRGSRMYVHHMDVTMRVYPIDEKSLLSLSLTNGFSLLFFSLASGFGFLFFDKAYDAGSAAAAGAGSARYWDFAAMSALFGVIGLGMVVLSWWLVRQVKARGMSVG